MAPVDAALVFLGALAGGFVNGLTGFGTGLTAIGIWLHVLPPAVTASLVIVTSVLGQIQSLPVVWRRIDWSRAWPFVLAGLPGALLGSALLAVVDPRGFKLGIGVLLLVYAAFALLRPARAAVRPSPAAEATVGLAGGVLGGLAGLSGPAMVIWTDLCGEAKDTRRALLQTFNLAVLLAALAAHAVSGRLDTALGLAVLAALPGTVVGAFAGAALYRRLGDRDYRRIVLTLVAVSGGVLVATAR